MDEEENEDWRRCEWHKYAFGFAAVREGRAKGLSAGGFQYC